MNRALFRRVASAAALLGAAGLLAACSSGPAEVATPTGIGSTSASAVPAPTSATPSTEPVGSTEYCSALEKAKVALDKIKPGNTNMKLSEAYSAALLKAVETAPTDMAVWLTALAEVTGPDVSKAPAETRDFVFLEAPKYFKQIQDECGIDLSVGG